MPRISVGRDLTVSSPTEEMFASIERELRRTTGEAVYEPSMSATSTEEDQKTES